MSTWKSSTGGSQKEKENNNNIDVDKIIQKSIMASMAEMKKIIEEMVPKLIEKEICRRIGGASSEEMREDSLEEEEGLKEENNKIP